MTNKPQIKVILLDVGGVLVRLVDNSLHKKWEEKLHLKTRQLNRELHKVEPADLATLGLVDGDTLWLSLQERFNLTDDELHQLRKDYYTHDLRNDVFYEYIRTLRLRDKYKIVLLSNAWKDARRVFTERYHLDEITDQMILSAEEGMVKPHKKIFKLALRRLGVQPEEALFVDDARKNIKAADEVGMHTVLFTHTKETIEKMDVLLDHQK